MEHEIAAGEVQIEIENNGTGPHWLGDRKIMPNEKAVLSKSEFQPFDTPVFAHWVEIGQLHARLIKPDGTSVDLKPTVADLPTPTPSSERSAAPADLSDVKPGV